MKHDAQHSLPFPSIILVGPPNAGKTTLFNTLTGSRYKTMNYPGSTVSYHKGKTLSTLGFPAEVVDTPGIQSLNVCSLDQEITYRFLFEKEHKEVVVVVVDATQLGRHLYLVEQIKECGFALMICVTMEDMLIENGKVLDVEELSKQMGVPSVILDARKESKLSRLLSKVREVQISMQPKCIQAPQVLSMEEIRARHEKTEKIEKRVLQGRFTGREKQLHTHRLLLHFTFWQTMSIHDVEPPSLHCKQLRP
jgi:ferrous iron transport protein B